jgi:predicted regulator of Ras-like GTPase activity (Roadblock/LC7/MglB family)
MFATGGMVCQRMDLGELREILIRGEKGYTILLFSDLILAGAGSDVSTLAIALRAFRMNFARIHAIFHPEFAKKHNLMF